MKQWKILLHNGDVGLIEGSQLLQAIRNSPFHPNQVKSYTLV